MPPSNQTEQQTQATKNATTTTVPLSNVTPSHKLPIEELPADHPVHKMSPVKQEELRRKGLNPVLKAEMDAAMSNAEGKGVWVKMAQTFGSRG